MQKPLHFYQPFLLRVLHGLVGVFTIAAMTSGFWVYDMFDGRWGRLNLFHVSEIQEIHGSLGILSFLAFPAFVIYSFTRGQKRLVQPNFLQSLVHSRGKRWWFTAHQTINTFSFIPLVLALFSGQKMDGNWLPNRELHHFWYLVHIASWSVLLLSLMAHFLLSAKVGGVPLLLSIVNLRFTSKESPVYWPNKIKTWFKNFRFFSIVDYWKSSGFYQYIEAALLASYALSLMLSALHEF
jgi:hypothetical protein